MIFYREQETEAEVSAELKVEDELSKATAIKMAAKLVSVDLVNSGKNTVKVRLCRISTLSLSVSV